MALAFLQEGQRPDDKSIRPRPAPASVTPAQHEVPANARASTRSTLGNGDGFAFGHRGFDLGDRIGFGRFAVLHRLGRRDGGWRDACRRSSLFHVGHLRGLSLDGCQAPPLSKWCRRPHQTRTGANESGRVALMTQLTFALKKRLAEIVSKAGANLWPIKCSRVSS